MQTEFFTCKYCECDLTSKEYLNYHERYCKLRMERKHKSDEDVKVDKVYKCTYCEYSSKFSGNLKKHISGKHEKQNKGMFNCKICGYKSYWKSSLQQHFKIHEESKFGCVKCNIMYSQKQNLYEHYIQKHPEKYAKVTSRIHQCNYCTFRTVCKSKLHQHKCLNIFEKQKQNNKKVSCTHNNYSTNKE
ncbi:zinc finger Y-chromosomal protein-like [Diorhabda carinulata]|uniref:zinc finger Y-chromosomal protein-like n=1 Tax=Diorhabda carinulata TaxID=1163345 RepID=UPI0025A0D2CF|nr:zinc finger Y-chromosomal protein-like [Diorhabda carinulata]